MQVQQLALPGPGGEQPPEIVSNVNKLKDSHLET